MTATTSGQMTMNDLMKIERWSEAPTTVEKLGFPGLEEPLMQ
jgi:hypothetical protein